MIDMIIWSKNRPMQLDLLLRSMYKFFPKINTVSVLYCFTDGKYEQGYKTLKKEHYGVNFILQKDFKVDLINILNNLDNEYILGNSDDNVFINKVDIESFKLENNVVAMSLRLNKNIDYCQPANLKLNKPQFVYVDNILYWEWIVSDPRGCWGYPHPCDSNIYDRRYLITLIKNGRYNNPASLEVWMNTHRDINRPKMKCFTESKLINIVNNRVQSNSQNSCGNITAEELNNKYLEGMRISFKNIYHIESNQCHIQIPFDYEDTVIR